MIDRIEELLSEMAADDEEEEQEDVLALPVAEEAVSASPRKDKGEAGDGETGDRSGGRTAGEIALERPGLIAGETKDGKTGDRSGGRTAGEIVLEQPGRIAGETKDGKTGDRSGGRTVGEIVLGRLGLIAGEAGDGEPGDRSGGRTAGEIALERPGLIAGETKAESADAAEASRELWKDGPVWTVRSGSPEIDEARKVATAGRTAQAEETPQSALGGELIWTGLEPAVRGGTIGTALEGAGRSGSARDGLEQAGLKGLYRQTVQGLRPAAPALPPEQTGKTARAQEPGSAASLAVDELDRAVRRDSRRYDGGMSIY